MHASNIASDIACNMPLILDVRSHKISSLVLFATVGTIEVSVVLIKLQLLGRPMSSPTPAGALVGKTMQVNRVQIYDANRALLTLYYKNW